MADTTCDIVPDSIANGIPADWVEHVAEFGSYLRTPEAGMPWAVRNSLDVAATWLGAVLALLATLRCLFRFVLGLWRRRVGGSAERLAARKKAQ